MRAHGEAREDDIRVLFGPDGDDDHLVRVARLGKLHRRLDGVLVERVHRHADVVGLDPGAIRPYADTDGVIDDPLDGNENLHRRGAPSEIAAS